MRDKVIGMNIDQFICLKHQKMIKDTYSCSTKYILGCVGADVCPFLRLTSVSLGNLGDIVCKEHIIPSKENTKTESKKYTRECKRRSYVYE